MNRLAGVIVGSPRLVAGTLMVLSIVAVIGATRLEVKDRYSDIFRSNDPRFHHLEQLTQLFGAGENDCLVLLESRDVLSPEVVGVVRRAHQLATDIPGVESVLSMHSVRGNRRIGRYYLPLLSSKAAVTDEVRDSLLSHPFVGGRLVSHDLTATLMLVRLDQEQGSILEVDAVLQQLRQMLVTETRQRDISFGMSGLPVIRSETLRILKADHLKISLTGITLATLLAWGILRHLSQVIIVVAPATLGVAWTLGLMGLCERHLGMLNSTLPALLLVIGVTDAIHMVFHFRRERSCGKSAAQSAASAVAELGGACFLTSLTTAIGFVSLVATQDVMIRDLGVWAAIGVTLTFCCVITLTPLLLMTRLGRMNVRQQTSGGRRMAGWSFLLRRDHRLVAATGLLVLVVATVSASRLTPDYSFVEHLPSNGESATVMRQCEKHFGGVPLLQVLVGWSDESASRGQLLNILAAVHHAIEKTPSVNAPTSLLTLLESLPGNADDLAGRFGELRRLPKESVERLVRFDHNRAVVTALAPDAGFATLRSPLDELSDRLHEIESAHAGFTLGLTGFKTVATYRANAMIVDTTRSLGLASLVIFVVIAVAFRSWRLALVSIVPNGLPLLATAATIAVLGVPLQYVTVMAFSVCLGVAVDDTIHFLTRYARERHALGDSRLAMERTLAMIGPVLLTTTALMITGFAAGMSAGLVTARSFAMYACLALLFALLCDLLLLPSLVLWIDRDKHSPR